MIPSPQPTTPATYPGLEPVAEVLAMAKNWSERSWPEKKKKKGRQFHDCIPVNQSPLRAKCDIQSVSHIVEKRPRTTVKVRRRCRNLLRQSYSENDYHLKFQVKPPPTDNFQPLDHRYQTPLKHAPLIWVTIGVRHHLIHCCWSFPSLALHHIHADLSGMLSIDHVRVALTMSVTWI